MHGIEVVQPGLEPVFGAQRIKYNHDTPDRRQPSAPERRVFGLRRVTFWLVAALAALSIIGVGVPVGLKVGRGSHGGTTGTEGKNTILTPTLGMLKHPLLCDSDFDGAKEDLALMLVSTFGDCMNLCNSMNYFQKRTDVGCTYNVAGTGTQTLGTCWCLGGDTKTVVANVGN
ncbi:hypothetical protein NKR19_g5851 [Coniochaeta hoffmannii]|uniref:Uncharacterized protein n=1 Tax=Coniochaeta hoffmannii TaxID=91930 RepID=A0AA38RFH1_9PEZI|nr:hypothetical protein NKR19_g5851 [Coniochaeta hoffmannii]